MLVSEASEYIPCQTIAVVGRRSTLPGLVRTSQKRQQTMPHDVFMAPLLEVRASTPERTEFQISDFRI